MSDTDLQGQVREAAVPARAVRTMAAKELAARHGDTTIDMGLPSEMMRIAAFCATSWLAACVLYFGRHSVALIAVCAVLALGGYDLFRPD